jgi:hypothetical protein
MKPPRAASLRELEARRGELPVLVQRTRQPLLARLRGRPVAATSPHDLEKIRAKSSDPLRGGILSLGDLIAPIDAIWDSRS